jgi:hypothetical protein
VSRQASTAVTGCLVGELKAKSKVQSINKLPTLMQDLSLSPILRA